MRGKALSVILPKCPFSRWGDWGWKDQVSIRVWNWGLGFFSPLPSSLGEKAGPPDHNFRAAEDTAQCPRALESSLMPAGWPQVSHFTTWTHSFFSVSFFLVSWKCPNTTSSVSCPAQNRHSMSVSFSFFFFLSFSFHLLSHWVVRSSFLYHNYFCSC